MQPGDRSEMHLHPDYLVHMLSDGEVKFTRYHGTRRKVHVMPPASPETN